MSRGIRIGDFRHRVDIQYPTLTPNSIGERVRAWATKATVWARVEPIRGRERMDAMQVQQEMSHRVVIRGGTVTVLPTDRIRFGTRILNIVAPPANREERDVEVEIMCVEEVPEP
jgi:SPP1 family predicted phage head-tail adaptor